MEALWSSVGYLPRGDDEYGAMIELVMPSGDRRIAWYEGYKWSSLYWPELQNVWGETLASAQQRVRAQLDMDHPGWRQRYTKRHGKPPDNRCWRSGRSRSTPSRVSGC